MANIENPSKEHEERIIEIEIERLRTFKEHTSLVSFGRPLLLWLISQTVPSRRFSSVRPSLVILVTFFLCL